MSERALAVDVVRGLALVGMVVQHGLWSSGWLSFLGELPAVLFVVTTGAGAGLRHAAQDRHVGTRRRNLLDTVWRIGGLAVLGACLVAVDGPLAVVLPTLAAIALFLEPFGGARSWAASVAAVGLGACLLLAHITVESMPLDVRQSWWSSAIAVVGVETYPVPAWILCGAVGYAMGRHWTTVRSWSPAAAAVAGVGALVAAGTGRWAVAALPADGWAELVDHQMWEWAHDDGTRMQLLDLARLTPYSGSPVMVLMTTSIAVLLLLAAAAALRREGVVKSLVPVSHLGRVALTGYVLHVLLSARCMSPDDLSWTCGELRDGRMVAAQLIAFLGVATLWRAVGWPANGPVELLLRLPRFVHGAVGARCTDESPDAVGVLSRQSTSQSAAAEVAPATETHRS